MSLEDIGIIEAGLRAFNEREVQRFADLTTDDFVWLPALPGAVDAGSYVGRSGIERYFSESRDTWEELTVVHDELRDLGDGVLVLGHAVGRGLGSGVPVEMPLAFIAEFRDGRIAKVSTYLSHEQAVEAADGRSRSAPRDRVQLLRRLIELWNDGERDLAIFHDHLDPGIELESPFAYVSGEPYRGYAGIERWMRDVDEQFAEWSITVNEVRATADRVVAIATISARGRGSEVSLQFPAASVCDFGADDRLTHMHVYLDVAEALKDAGMEPGSEP